ncbi:MAG TPA: hypothetical protein VGX48_01645, partial [Pyrinomonadaceae bacterium]|nr:hypothetical protein [Pyrinomonadaceae bacterium]
LRGRSLGGIPLPGVPLADDFDDDSLDADLWAQIDSGHPALEQNQRLELQPCAGTYSGVALDAQDFTNHYSAVKFVQQSNSDAMTMAWNFGAYTLHFLVRASGALWPYIYGPSGFVTNGAQGVTVSAGMLLRVRHVSSTDTFQWHYSTDGGATWTLYHSFSGLGQSLASVVVHLRQYDASGVAIFDDFTTDIGADDFASKDKYVLAVDAANDRFGLQKTLGMVRVVSGLPSGAPSDLPSGHTEVRLDATGHNFCVWNPNTSQWDYVNLPHATS